MLLGTGLGIGMGGGDPYAALRALYPTLPVQTFKAFWDAERADLITQAAGAVSNWTDVTGNAYALSQSGAGKPIYSATSFNSRPGVTFAKASSQFLNRTGMGSLPSGATPCEIWILCDQTLAAADTALGVIFDYGNSTNAYRRVDRTVVSAVNRARAITGSGAGVTIVNNATADFSGKQVVRAIISATATQVDVSGTAGAGSAVVPATSSGNIIMGRSNGGSAPFEGVINAVLVTSDLGAADAAALLAYLKTRGGIA